MFVFLLLKLQCWLSFWVGVGLKQHAAQTYGLHPDDVSGTGSLGKSAV